MQPLTSMNFNLIIHSEDSQNFGKSHNRGQSSNETKIKLSDVQLLLYFLVTCADWELRVWTVNKQTGDRFSVDKLCGQAKQNNITIPQVVIIMTIFFIIIINIVRFTLVWCTCQWGVWALVLRSTVWSGRAQVSSHQTVSALSRSENNVILTIWSRERSNEGLFINDYKPQKKFERGLIKCDSSDLKSDADVRFLRSFCKIIILFT